MSASTFLARSTSWAVGLTGLQTLNLVAAAAPVTLALLLHRPLDGLPGAAVGCVTASLLLKQWTITRHTTRPLRTSLLLWCFLVTVLVWLLALGSAATWPGIQASLALVAVALVQAPFVRRLSAGGGYAGALLAQFCRSIDLGRLGLLVVLSATVLGFHPGAQLAAATAGAVAFTGSVLREVVGTSGYCLADVQGFFVAPSFLAGRMPRGVPQAFGVGADILNGVIFQAAVARRNTLVIESWLTDFVRNRRRPDLAHIRALIVYAMAATTKRLWLPSEAVVSPSGATDQDHLTQSGALAQRHLQLAEVLLGLAEAESNREDLARARADRLRTAVRRELLALLWAQATVFERRGQLDEACAVREQTVERCARWEPRDAGYFQTELLLLLFNMGRYDELRARALAWAEEPRTPGYMRQRLFATAAMAAWVQEDSQAAAELLRRARSERWTLRGFVQLRRTIARYRHTVPAGRVVGLASAGLWRRQSHSLLTMATVATSLAAAAGPMDEATEQWVSRTFTKQLPFRTDRENPSRRLVTHGWTLAARGNRRRADRVLRRALRTAEQDGQPGWTLQALRALSEVASDRDRYEEAYLYAARALPYAENARAASVSVDVRLHDAELLEGVYRALVTLLLLYCNAGKPRRSPATRWPRHPEIEAYGVIESAKSRLLSELLGSAMTLPEALELADTERQLADRWAQALRALDGELPDRPALEELRRAKGTLDDARQRLRALGGRAAEYADLRAGKPLPFGRIRELLAAAPQPAVLCSYYHLSGGTFVLVIARADQDDPVLVHVTADADLTARGAIGARLDADHRLHAWTDSSSWLAGLSALIEPLADHSAPGEVIWFVPHDDLHHIPLHALLLEGAPLATRNPVCYSPNATTMWHCWNHPTDSRRVLIATDPDGRLPLLRHHASELSQMWGADAVSISGKQVTTRKMTRLLRDKQGYRVVHLSSHGIYDADRPMRSGILTAPTDGEREGRLTAKDLLELRCHADLVVLAACDTGVNAGLPGDELIGLTRAVLYAGAASVLVSLWPVDQTATAYLLSAFHSALAQGQGKAEALRSAQATLRTRTAQDIVDALLDQLADPALDPASLTVGWLTLRLIKAREAAGDHAQALRACNDLMSRHPADPALTAEMRRAAARCRRATRARAAVNYQARPYLDPFYWAPFVLIGDWR